jgi:hypothetical protein
MIRHAGLPDAEVLAKIWPPVNERKNSRQDKMPPKKHKGKYRKNGKKPEPKWDKNSDE